MSRDDELMELSDFNHSDEWHKFEWIEQDDDGFFERPFKEPKGEKHYLTESEVIDFLLEGHRFLFDKLKKLEAQSGHSEMKLDLNSPNTVTAVKTAASPDSDTNTKAEKNANNPS